MWTDDYLAIPFAFDGRDRDGCDCWGLLRLIYQEQLGIELPAYSDVPAAESHLVLQEMVRQSGARPWFEVPLSDLREFDVVRMIGHYRDAQGTMRRGPIHVACAVDADTIIHIEPGRGVLAQSIRDQLIARRIVAVHRHEALA